jgi:uncharacterized protein YjiS (DUF1127 family)
MRQAAYVPLSSALSSIFWLAERGAGRVVGSGLGASTPCRRISGSHAPRSIPNGYALNGSRPRLRRALQNFPVQEITMFTHSTTAGTCGTSEGVDPRGTSLRRLLEALAAWRRRRRQRAELYALSDRTLKDIGVSRWEIEAIVGSPYRDASGRAR